MRLLAFLAGLLFLLFVRVEFQRVGTRILAGSRSSATMLQYTPPQPTYVDVNALVNQLHPEIDVNSEQYERIAVQAQADEAVRQSRSAQDQAWQAEHPDL